VARSGDTDVELLASGDSVTQIVPLPRARAPRGTHQTHRLETFGEDEVTVVFSRPARSS
jgi:hypothetical protein